MESLVVQYLYTKLGNRIFTFNPIFLHFDLLIMLVPVKLHTHLEKFFPLGDKVFSKSGKGEGLN